LALTQSYACKEETTEMFDFHKFKMADSRYFQCFSAISSTYFSQLWYRAIYTDAWIRKEPCDM